MNIGVNYFIKSMPNNTNQKFEGQVFNTEGNNVNKDTSKDYVVESTHFFDFIYP